jgi:trehalose 6-phosphate synthase/phosphatase
MELPKEVEDTIEVLGKLAEDWKNEVWLLSGLRVKGVLECVAERVPRVGIVAENGCFVKMRGEANGGGADAGIMGGREWISMVSNLNLTWKSACLEILHYVGCSGVVICVYVCAHTGFG